MRWKLPASHGFHIPFQVIAACFCIYWYLYPPMPNKAVLAIGVVAVVMTLTEMRPSHKAAWLVIVFFLAFVENRAIEKERANNEMIRAETRKQENAQFQKIADGINAAIEENDRNFQATMGQTNRLLRSGERTTQIATHAVEAITGGSSFPSISISFGGPDPTHIGLLAFLNRTKDVGMFRYQVVQLAPPENDHEKAFCQNQRPIGGMWSGDSAPIQPQLFVTLPVSLTPSPTGITQYRIVMDYKNGRYVQCVEVRPSTCGGNRVFDSRSELWRRTVLIFDEKWPDCPKQH